MNREQLINYGRELETIWEVSDLEAKYEIWKEYVLEYVRENQLDVEKYRMLMYAPRIPWETKEEKLKKYHNSIEKVFAILEKQEEKSEEKKTLEKLVGNFGLYLQTMFKIIPEKKSTLQKSDLEKIVINNEYDVQHIMYAVIKALYPSARREVNQDIGYATARYDIVIEEIDTVVEIKCTRTDHSEKKLFRELGEDAFFYKCSKLLMYVYDKENVISDVDNFVKALERDKETAGKEIKVYVEQMNQLI